ncbi:MAG TPA: hypothetical protein VGA36_01260 [Nitriliruptorales bacterium]
MNELLAMGVDGIFTNRPDVLRAAVDTAGSGVSAEVRGNPSAFPAGCPGVAGTVGQVTGDVDSSPEDPAGEGSGSDLPASGGGFAVMAIVAAAVMVARRRR